MRFPRTTIPGMMASIGILALILGALKYPSTLLFGIVLTLTIQLYGFASYRTFAGRTFRPFWAAFAVAGPIFLVLTVAPYFDLHVGTRLPTWYWIADSRRYLRPIVETTTDVTYSSGLEYRLSVDDRLGLENFIGLDLAVGHVLSQIHLPPEVHASIRAGNPDAPENPSALVTLMTSRQTQRGHEFTRIAHTVASVIIAIVVAIIVDGFLRLWRHRPRRPTIVRQVS